MSLFSRLYFDFFSRNLTSLISHYNDFNLEMVLFFYYCLALILFYRKGRRASSAKGGFELGSNASKATFKHLTPYDLCHCRYLVVGVFLPKRQALSANIRSIIGNVKKRRFFLPLAWARKKSLSVVGALTGAPQLFAP